MGGRGSEVNGGLHTTVSAFREPTCSTEELAHADQQVEGTIGGIYSARTLEQGIDAAVAGTGEKGLDGRHRGGKLGLLVPHPSMITDDRRSSRARALQIIYHMCMRLPACLSQKWAMLHRESSAPRALAKIKRCTQA